MFRRKRWRYLILDEAHMIKNWKSQRWQTLLRFNSKRRLLITGTLLTHTHTTHTHSQTLRERERERDAHTHTHTHRGACRLGHRKSVRLCGSTCRHPRLGWGCCPRSVFVACMCVCVCVCVCMCVLMCTAGTPLQNDMMELWSLMHFLMPDVCVCACVCVCVLTRVQARLYRMT